MALLPDIQTLSCEDSQLIEGSVAQYAEALAALSKMKKNKSPGSNGFSVEFFFFLILLLNTVYKIASAYLFSKV